jgi:large subunit ribosomal protein L15
MKAPVRSRLRPEGVQPLKINADPKKLDQVYVKFLGQGGDKMLSEESKWLAVTHKSFDHGRRGFNDRLAFLGKRILELQTSLSLLALGDSSRYLRESQDPYGREPFEHPATKAVECLRSGARTWFTHHKQISNLSAQYGIPDVVRWVPKNVRISICPHDYLRETN